MCLLLGHLGAYSFFIIPYSFPTCSPPSNINCLRNLILILILHPNLVLARWANKFIYVQENIIWAMIPAIVEFVCKRRVLISQLNQKRKDLFASDCLMYQWSRRSIQTSSVDNWLMTDISHWHDTLHQQRCPSNLNIFYHTVWSIRHTGVMGTYKISSHVPGGMAIDSLGRESVPGGISGVPNVAGLHWTGMCRASTYICK